MKALVDIQGIGPQTAALLSESGFPDVQAVATATPEGLAAVKGFSVARAAKTIESAKALLNEAAVEDVAVEPEKEVAAAVKEIVSEGKKKKKKKDGDAKKDKKGKKGKKGGKDKKKGKKKKKKSK